MNINKDILKYLSERYARRFPWLFIPLFALILFWVIVNKIIPAREDIDKIQVNKNAIITKGRVKIYPDGEVVLKNLPLKINKQYCIALKAKAQGDAGCIRVILLASKPEPKMLAVFNIDIQNFSKAYKWCPLLAKIPEEYANYDLIITLLPSVQKLKIKSLVINETPQIIGLFRAGVLLGLLSCLVFLVLHFVFQEKLFTIFESKPILIFLCIFIVYLILLTTGLMKIYSLTGDEHMYMLVTHSIVSDGDIDIRNNHFNNDYKQFGWTGISTPTEENFRHIKTCDNKDIFYGGNGLPMLLAPSYAVYGIFGVRVFISFITAIQVMLIYLLLKEMGVARIVNFIITFAFAFTNPLLFFSVLVYPEIFCGTVITLVWYLKFKETNKNLSGVLWGVTGVLLGLIPFLAVKYLTLSISITGALVLIWLVEKKKKNVLIFLPFFSLGTFLYFYYLYHTFGVWSPLSQYSGVETYSGPISRGAFKDIIAFFVGYFFDQREGILFLAPYYFLIFAGIIYFLKNIHKYWKMLLLVVIPSGIYLSLWAYTLTPGHNNGREFVAIIGSLAILLGMGLTWCRNLNIKIIPIILISISISIAIIICLIGTINSMGIVMSLDSFLHYRSLFWNHLISINPKVENLIYSVPSLDIGKYFPLLMKEGNLIESNTLKDWLYCVIILFLFSLLFLLEKISWGAFERWHQTHNDNDGNIKKYIPTISGLSWANLFYIIYLTIVFLIGLIILINARLPGYGILGRL